MSLVTGTARSNEAAAVTEASLLDRTPLILAVQRITLTKV
jgi:hypothetical protein